MELVLNSFGASLSRDNEGFVISYQDGKQRIPPIGITSIQISRGAQITSDAVLLAIEREIEVVFTDKAGNPMGRIWSPRYGSISTISKRPDKAFAFLKSNGESYFVSPPLVQKYNLQNSDKAKAVVVYDYDKKKDVWNWSCVSIQKLS